MSPRPRRPCCARVQVGEIKDLLVSRGFEAEVFSLASSRPAPKKADWVALARTKLEAA